MQFTVPFHFINRYWNQVHSKHKNFVQYIIGIRTETRQRIIVAHGRRRIYLPVYLYLTIELCLFV